MRTQFGKYKDKWFNDVTSSALILILLAVLAHSTHLFSRVDHLIYDIGQRLITKPAPKDVVIVAIDENSLSILGRWPWSRRTHAQLIQTLAPEQPAAIGFDIILAEADSNDQEGDAALADSMTLSGNVVLPVLIERIRNNGQLIETLPFQSLMDVAADVGSVHTVLDQDSIARSVYRYEGLNTPAWQLFAQAVLNVAYDLPSKNHFIQDDDTLSPNLFTVARKDHVGVYFSGPPGHFQTISYAQVINGEFAKGTFENKIVLVGATASGMNDMLSTPVSGLSVPMPGVEFHANILESIRSHQLIRHIPSYASLLIVITLSVAPLIWMPKLNALHGFLVTFFYGLFVLLLAGVLPKTIGIWVPPTAALFAISLAYPLWSWRKLEAAQQYLNYELDYLKQNLHQPAEYQAEYVDHFDRFDARISQVREAATQLRSLQDDRKETLAFISHDIRAPLKAALNVIEESPQEVARLNQFLSQAHYLAEDFLQTSRAEMMEKSGFQEIDMVSLIHQCVDAAYDAAKEKNIQLVRIVYEGSIWVDGNFGLLERAILNLILNAIKFAPEQTKVEVKCHLFDEDVVFSVTDFGAGISQLEQKKLFKRFSRLEGHANTEGSGLGLYFVKTVAEKHNGDAGVNSVAGQFTTFSMQLPVVAHQLYE